MQTVADKVRALVTRVCQRENSNKKCRSVRATFKEADWLLAYHSRLPA